MHLGGSLHGDLSQRSLMEVIEPRAEVGDLDLKTANSRRAAVVDDGTWAENSRCVSANAAAQLSREIRRPWSIM